MSLLEAAGPVAHASISASAQAANAVVEAISGLRIRVLQLVLSNNSTDTAVNVTVEDQDGNDLIGPIRLAAGATQVLPFSPVGWGDAPTGKGLSVRLSDGVSVGGSLAYQKIK